MLIFGHVGLSLGAAALLGGLLRKVGPGPAHSAGKGPGYPWVALGALLPDIIDKPLWLASVGNGSIIGHSLLFNLGLVALGLYIWSTGRTAWLFLSLASLGHLALDGMWRHPETLWWPLYGWALPSERVAPIQWLREMVEALGTQPAALLPELLGALVMAAFLLRPARRRLRL